MKHDYYAEPKVARISEVGMANNKNQTEEGVQEKFRKEIKKAREEKKLRELRETKVSKVANPGKIENVNGVIFKKPPRPDGIFHARAKSMFTSEEPGFAH
jgi:hypothetical protein